MADAAEIARRAMEIASKYIDSDSKKLAEMAQGDLEVLRDAARIVQEQAPPKKSRLSLSPEHIAFSLITAAYESLREEPKE